MKRKDDLTREFVMSRLFYDVITGILYWKYDRNAPDNWNTRWESKIAGTYETKYVSVSLNGSRYLAQRLIWLVVTGEWPSTDVDHVNGDKRDNRFNNLRLATRSQNNGNSGIKKSNASGVKGVHWGAKHDKWRASISEHGKIINLGRYDCIAAASFAYQIAADKHFGEFARFK